MNKINILITSIGGDIGANIFKILQEQTKFHCSLFGTDIKKYVFCKKNLTHFYQVPRVSDPTYTDVLIKIAKNDKIHLIIPSSEYDIVYFNQNRSLFENLNVKLLINHTKIINSFLDKFITSKILNNLKIATPETYLLSDYNNELGFPIILKALKSTISKEIKIIKTQNELNQIIKFINTKNEYILQKYIGSSEEEYTTTVYKNQEMTKTITFRRTLDGDKTGYAEIVNSAKLDYYSRLLADNFSLNGSINIQSRLYNDDYYIFEINPRISSTVYIRNHFNFNDLIWWVSDKLNMPIDTNSLPVKESGIGVLGYTYEFYDSNINC